MFAVVSRDSSRTKKRNKNGIEFGPGDLPLSIYFTAIMAFSLEGGSDGKMFMSRGSLISFTSRTLQNCTSIAFIVKSDNHIFFLPFLVELLLSHIF